MKPSRESFYNERGEKGHADAFFMVERGEYVAVLVARRRWVTANRRLPRSQKWVQTYRGASARDLAKKLREDGWSPPRGLKALCESAPRSRVAEARS